jgi:CheY-like chemotaxis protein
MPKASIVVVEDEPAIRRGVSDALRLSGYDVTEAGDGVHGLREGSAAGVDLVLLDLLMPRRDGLDLQGAGDERQRGYRRDRRLRVADMVTASAPVHTGAASSVKTIEDDQGHTPTTLWSRSIRDEAGKPIPHSLHPLFALPEGTGAFPVVLAALWISAIIAARIGAESFGQARSTRARSGSDELVHPVVHPESGTSAKGLDLWAFPRSGFPSPEPTLYPTHPCLPASVKSLLWASHQSGFHSTFVVSVLAAILNRNMNT